MLHIAIVEDEEIYARLLEEFVHRYERDSFCQFKTGLRSLRITAEDLILS